jgi:hypothetical protein
MQLRIMGATSLATFVILLIIQSFASHVILLQSILWPTLSFSCRNALPLAHTLSLSLRCLSLFSLLSI